MYSGFRHDTRYHCYVSRRDPHDVSLFSLTLSKCGRSVTYDNDIIAKRYKINGAGVIMITWNDTTFNSMAQAYILVIS